MHIEQDDHFLSDDAGEKLRAAQAIQGTTEVVLLRLSLRGRDTVMTNSCVMQREATHVQSIPRFKQSTVQQELSAEAIQCIKK